MKDAIEELANSLIPVSEDTISTKDALPPNLQSSYLRFLSLCDGGYTSDHFFHFFGQKGPREHNLIEWNQANLWKKYFGLDSSLFVFAEDVLGTQFCFDLRGNRRIVKMFIPGNGNCTLCANTFEEFAEQQVLLDSTESRARKFATDYFLTGSAAFRPFTHISCKIPSVLGGDATDFNNLELGRSSTNLKILGQVITQVKKLLPGTRISQVKVDWENEEILLVTAEPPFFR